MADYAIQPLTPSHVVAAFDCGKPELNKWIHSHAQAAESRHTARTFVLLDEERVIGFYSLCMHRVQDKDLAGRIARGGPDQVPAVMLAQLARDTSMRGERIGDLLMSDVLRRALAADKAVAARVLLVEALDEDAVSFYQRHNFLPAASNPLKLAVKMTDVEQTVKTMDEWASDS